jgi:D-alanine--poly(phosphoribitol) ligase subunit 2
MTQVKDFLRNEIKGLAFKQVQDGDSLLKSGLLDSITAVDLAVAIENEYNLQIPFTEITAENFETINSIYQYLQTKGLTL